MLFANLMKTIYARYIILIKKNIRKPLFAGQAGRGFFVAIKRRELFYS